MKSLDEANVASEVPDVGGASPLTDGGLVRGKQRYVIHLLVRMTPAELGRTARSGASRPPAAPLLSSGSPRHDDGESPIGVRIGARAVSRDYLNLKRVVVRAQKRGESIGKPPRVQRLQSVDAPKSVYARFQRIDLDRRGDGGPGRRAARGQQKHRHEANPAEVTSKRGVH